MARPLKRHPAMAAGRLIRTVRMRVWQRAVAGHVRPQPAHQKRSMERLPVMRRLYELTPALAVTVVFVAADG